MKHVLYGIGIAVLLLLSACQKENTPSPSGATARTTDSLALVALYKSTDGDNWSKNTSDNRDVRFRLNQPITQHRSWNGVSTAVIDGVVRVTGINLNSFNLTGTLPEEIGNLTELKSINLSANWHLSGNIPESFYNLTQLEVWKMQFTIITGELSPSIANLAKLDTLDLWTSNYEMLDNFNHIDLL